MGWNTAQTGLLVAISPVLMAVSYLGQTMNKVDPQKLTTLGMGLVTIGLFILIFLNKKYSSTSFSIIIMFPR